MILETLLDRARKRMQSSKFPRLNRKKLSGVFFKKTRRALNVFNFT